MSFYSDPPVGHISFENLEKFASIRLRFLCDLMISNEAICIFNNTKNVISSDCLIEGTQADLVSHFILRLLCCQNGEMSKLLVNAEMKLFKLRFSNFDNLHYPHLVRSLKKIHVDIKKNSDMPSKSTLKENIAIFLQNLTYNYSIEQLVQMRMRNINHKYVKMPFEFFPQMVAAREVNLQGGLLKIPTKYLPDIFMELFGLTLRQGLLHAGKQLHLVDFRLENLFKKLQAYFNRVFYNGGGSLKSPLQYASTVALKSHQFPLCMQQALRALRANHRLRHHARIQLTLFLKDLGLSWSENVAFWQAEYSQMCCPSTNSCSHSWIKDHNRYTYSIRHLYGLEGRQVSYQSHCCASIKKKGPLDEGECPFQTLYMETLETLLCDTGFSSAEHEAIVNLVQIGESNRACGRYLQAAACKKTSAKHTAKRKARQSLSGIADDDAEDVLYRRRCKKHHSGSQKKVGQHEPMKDDLNESHGDFAGFKGISKRKREVLSIGDGFNDSLDLTSKCCNYDVDVEDCGLPQDYTRLNKSVNLTCGQCYRRLNNNVEMHYQGVSPITWRPENITNKTCYQTQRKTDSRNKLPNFNYSSMDTSEVLVNTSTASTNEKCMDRLDSTSCPDNYDMVNNSDDTNDCVSRKPKFELLEETAYGIVNWQSTCITDERHVTLIIENNASEVCASRHVPSTDYVTVEKNDPEMCSQCCQHDICPPSQTSSTEISIWKPVDYVKQYQTITQS